MRRHAWRSIQNSWLATTSTLEIVTAAGSAGRVKVIGESGAVAEWGECAYSFRAGGVDPMKRISWRRHFGHDATILDLHSKECIAAFSVSPLHSALRIGTDPRYSWKRSFLMRSAFWRRNGEVVIRLFTPWLRQSGEILVEDSVSHRDEIILILFGLYLTQSGRA